MSRTRKKLGELLLEAGLIDEVQLNAALSQQRDWGGRIGTILVRKGYVTETSIISVIEQQTGMSCMPLEEFRKPGDEMLRLVRKDVARKFCVFPVEFDGRTLVVATPDPTDLKMLDDLGFVLGARIKPVLALESDVFTAIDHFYDPHSSAAILHRKAEEEREKPSSAEVEFEIIHSHDQPSIIDMMSKEAEARSVDSSVLGGLIDLLVQKGIFSREELAEKIRVRKQ
jgi:type IV pilus assembly protein PilB